MPIVQMPPVLRAAAGGQKSVQAEGATLGAVLDGLYEQYPALREQLKPGDDGLSRYVNIYVDDEDARTLQGVATALSAGSTVTILPAMAGGEGATA